MNLEETHLTIIKFFLYIYSFRNRITTGSDDKLGQNGGVGGGAPLIDDEKI